MPHSINTLGGENGRQSRRTNTVRPGGQAPAGERTSPGLDRRKFIRALGATAAAAAFLESEAAEGANQSTNPPPVLYQDSFGNIGPAGAVPGLARQQRHDVRQPELHPAQYPHDHGGSNGNAALASAGRADGYR